MNCCTPLLIKLDFLSPTGTVKLQRDSNAPSCGYYGNYTGDIDSNGYDYYEADIQYNSGSGFWTFSGKSTGFNDSTIYRSVNTNNPCNPVGLYTGGIYNNVIVEKDSLFDIYEFEPSLQYNPQNIGVNGLGSGIHLEKDVNFKFSFVDDKNRTIKTARALSTNSYCKGVSIDILTKDGATKVTNYLQGYINQVTINEKDNIKIFGYYEPNFGIRIRTKNTLLDQEGVTELFTYGNKLYIDDFQISDKNGTSKYLAGLTGAEKLETVPSGAVEEETIIRVAFPKINNKYIKKSSFDVYASQDPNFTFNPDNLVASQNLQGSETFSSLILDKSFGLEANKDYWFGIVGSSKIGTGNAIKFGPHVLYEAEAAPETLVANTSIKTLYKDAYSLDSFATGSINKYVTGNSGIIDKLLVSLTGGVTNIYEEEKFIFSTLPVDESGNWSYTSFDYSIEFKDPLNPYQNVSKKVKLTATGESINPVNSGMPLFELKDYDTGVPIDIGLNYEQSGVYLVVDTGHQYQNFKYKKQSF